MNRRNKIKKQEFGDFQTPSELTNKVLQIIESLDINPQSVIEPTCGQGNFIISAINIFNNLQSCIGVEINQTHLQNLSSKLQNYRRASVFNLINDDFFKIDWNQILENIPKPFLILGNPPWVTNSQLSKINGHNLPQKNNFQKYKGLEAITGKSNFDISEWMLLQYLQWQNKYSGTIAILCKTSVARKVVLYAWKNNYNIDYGRVYEINTAKYFNAAVNACLLIIKDNKKSPQQKCLYYKSLDNKQSDLIFSYQDSQLIANTTLYNQTKHLQGGDNCYKWRSGVKHDRSKIMELIKKENLYINGEQKTLHLENTLIYPLLKSSDISNGNTHTCRKYILLTQKYIGQDTNYIKDIAPQTWKYLQDNKHLFAKRASSIYRNKPQFSIFGVGDYTFAPWKVAISGLYKKLRFEVIGCIDNKPTILDDTVYFLSCKTEQEAMFIANILNSSVARDFYTSIIFWDNKRPITVELLKKINLQKLSQELDLEEQYSLYVQEYHSTKNCN